MSIDGWWWLMLIPVSFVVCLLGILFRNEQSEQSEFAPLRRQQKVRIVGKSGVSVINNVVILDDGGRVEVNGEVVHDSSQPSSVDLSSWTSGADSISADCSSSDSGSCGDGGGSCGDGGGCE